MTFEYHLFLPFPLADPAGILFFGHAFVLAHQAYEQFVCKHLSIEWENWFHHNEWFVPIKQTEATYYKPLLVGKNCKIEVSIGEVKSSSFSLTYRFYQEQTLCCIVTTVHVFCDKKTQTKRTIPQAILEQLRSRQASNSCFKTLDNADRGIFETQWI